MADPSFPNLFCTWCLIVVFPLFVYGHSREWVFRFMIWASMWLTMTPVDSNVPRDLVWMVACFMVLERVYQFVLKVQWRKATGSDVLKKEE